MFTRRQRLPFVAAASLAALVSACGSNTTSSSTSTPPGSSAKTATSGTVGASTPAGSAAPGTTTAAGGSCVADVDKVIATKATPESTTASLSPELVSKLDAAAQASFEQAATPGAIVGVRTPQGTWIKAYGVADHDTRAPMTADMHTRIGSVTKTFTGTVILQLAEQGKLSLDDPIDKYVPGIPNGDKVTLRLLANMTSGVASYTMSTKFTDKYFAHPETVFTPDELIAVGVSESPLFEPGAKFNYSNTNTVLLGKVIEKVTGKPAGEVITSSVSQPLGLANTTWPGESPAMPSPYAQGYTLQGGRATRDKPENATNWNPAWGWTAGEMISGMNDLLIYGRALGTGQGLLSPAAQRERLTSFPGPAGYGLALGCTGGWVGHTGELPGYNTSVFYDTQSDTTIIVQANSDINSGDCQDPSTTLADNPTGIPCRAPATRIFEALSMVIGRPFTPPSAG